MTPGTSIRERGVGFFDSRILHRGAADKIPINITSTSNSPYWNPPPRVLDKDFGTYPGAPMSVVNLIQSRSMDAFPLVILISCTGPAVRPPCWNKTHDMQPFDGAYAEYDVVFPSNVISYVPVTPDLSPYTMMSVPGRGRINGRLVEIANQEQANFQRTYQ